MSGGHYNYLYYKISDLAEMLETHDHPKRIAFKKLLFLVAEACHDIEWVDSSDYAPGDENQALDAVFDFLGDNKTNTVKAACFDRLMEQIDIIKETMVET